MVRVCVLLVVAFLFVDCMAQRGIDLPKCENISSTKSSWTVNINSKRNETGDWVTAFSAWKDSRNPSNISLSVSQKVIDCDEKQIVFVHGVLNGGEDDKLVLNPNCGRNVTITNDGGSVKETNSSDVDNGVVFTTMLNDGKDEKLMFHPKCGNNIAISYNERSVKKINSTDTLNGVVLTNRPLKNSELFEVRLDKRIYEYGSTWGIGIAIIAPETNDIPKTMRANRNVGTWMMFYNSVYQNGTKIFPNYVSDIDLLKVGDRIGVMRNNDGALHFFINGFNQGRAASNIPYPVYGVLELFYDGIAGTIVSN